MHVVIVDAAVETASLTRTLGVAKQALGIRGRQPWHHLFRTDETLSRGLQRGLVKAQC